MGPLGANAVPWHRRANRQGHAKVLFWTAGCAVPIVGFPLKGARQMANHPYLVAEQREGVRLTLSTAPRALCRFRGVWSYRMRVIRRPPMWRASNAPQVPNPKAAFRLHRPRWCWIDEPRGWLGTWSAEQRIHVAWIKASTALQKDRLRAVFLCLTDMAGGARGASRSWRGWT